MKFPARLVLSPALVTDGVTGWTAGAVAWAIDRLWLLLASGPRLDVLTMATLGACIGGASGAAAAARARQPLGAYALGAALFGAAGTGLVALGATLIGVRSPSEFAMIRVLAWTVTGVALTLAILWSEPGARPSPLGTILGLVTGLIAGVVAILSGPADFWQALAFAVMGTGCCVAAAADDLWVAQAVIDRIPSTQHPFSLAALREWCLLEGQAIALSEVRFACSADRSIVYPPAGGAIINGHAISGPAYLPADCIVAVGGNRYRVRTKVRA